VRVVATERGWDKPHPSIRCYTTPFAKPFDKLRTWLRTQFRSYSDAQMTLPTNGPVSITIEVSSYDGANGDCPQRNFLVMEAHYPGS
jgi:hypothetical protein